MKTKPGGIHYVRIITLGCSKNTVDSEFLAGMLVKSGFSVSHGPSRRKADAVIVNTCGFIHDAKEQSVNILIENLEEKKKGRLQKVYAIGCLVQRYKTEIQQELPELDGIYGLHEIEQMILDTGVNAIHNYYGSRILATPSHYAYLKISDGCDRKCSFCAIPLIKGKHVSRTVDALTGEAAMLADQGVKEIILIAQDLTSFGRDISRKPLLPELISRLSSIRGIEWIRMHYLYPTGVNDELMDAIINNPKVCRYVDIPLQHISDRILRSMNRGVTAAQTLQLIEKLRQRIPGIALRTSLITGYPGETTKEYNEMKSFIKTARFERLGIFKYSHEEDTAAYHFTDSVPERTKVSRYRTLMETQQEISYEINRAYIGRIMKVMVDDHRNNDLICRTEFDSPEIDNLVIVKNPVRKVAKGEFITVKITGADIYDLFGEMYGSEMPGITHA